LEATGGKTGHTKKQKKKKIQKSRVGTMVRVVPCLVKRGAHGDKKKNPVKQTGGVGEEGRKKQTDLGKRLRQKGVPGGVQFIKATEKTGNIGRQTL